MNEELLRQLISEQHETQRLLRLNIKAVLMTAPPLSSGALVVKGKEMKPFVEEMRLELQGTN